MIEGLERKNTPAKLKGLSASVGRGQHGWSGRHPMKGIAMFGDVTSEIE
jgi:hypothetical protein